MLRCNQITAAEMKKVKNSDKNTKRVEKEILRQEGKVLIYIQFFDIACI